MKRILFLLFSLIPLFVQAQWSTATLSEARSALVAASVGTKVFFAGGLSSTYSDVVDIYDQSTGTWSTATLSVARENLAATSVGSKVFFAGGWGGNPSGPRNRVDIYDNSTNTWTTATLSQSRYLLAATSVGTKVFFAGGFGSGASSVVDIYDNSTNTWSTATLSQARYSLDATTVGTKVFFAGGTSSGGRSNVVDIYDNSTNTWSTATLSQAREDLSAASVGTKVFFAGGYASTSASNVVDIYDNNTNTWSTTTLTQARNGIGATSVGTKVFFAGGSFTNVIDIYDNSTNTWSTATLSQGRHQVAATSTATKAYFGGGHSPIFSNVVDIYNLPPYVTGFSPTTGAAGDIVTLTGSYDPTPTNNLVYFNGTQATVSTSMGGSITVIVPIGATTGPISVTVFGVTETSSADFIVTGPTPQTITFPSISTKTYGNAPFSLTATASSGLPVTYTSSNTSVATVSGGTVTIVGAGTSTITASQGGDGTYRVAANVSRTLTVNKANQTITFSSIATKTYTSANFTLTATTTSGLPITFTSANTAVGVLINSNTIDVVGVGTSVITASQAGNANYNPAPNVNRTLNVNKASQTITFATPPTQTYNLVSYQFGGTTSSGLPLTYTSANPAVATIGGPNGNVATFTGVGTSSITASQPGDANFLAATSVTRTLTVNKGVQTITFVALDPVNSWDANFNLTATASSGLPVTYTSSNTAVATVSDIDADNVWTVDPNSPGTTNITATQSGNALWNAATNVVRPLVVKALQTITFGSIPSKNLGDAPFTLTATASSGLTVTYSSSDLAVATVSGNTLTIVGPGTTIITASQAGNAAYSSAPDVQQPFFVGLLSPVVAPSFIEFTSVTSTSMDINFSPGAGNRQIVIIKPNDPTNFFTPIDNQFYSAGYTSNGSMVVMSGTGTSATIMGLSPSTKYYVKVFSFNEVGAFTSYLTSQEANAAQTTLSSGGGGGARVASGGTTEIQPAKDYTRKPFDVKVYGNPFDERLTFLVESELSLANVTLTDVTGRIVHESTVETNKVVEIQKPMSKGLYLLKVSSGIDRKALQVIKTR